MNTDPSTESSTKAGVGNGNEAESREGNTEEKGKGKLSPIRGRVTFGHSSTSSGPDTAEKDDETKT
jgi:hypothetical protein